MPTYTVEIDGKQYDIAGDREPTEAEARQAVGAYTQPAGSAALAGATGISAPPAYQRRRIPGTNIDLPFSMEDVAEALPAAVATGAAFLGTRHPAAAVAAGSAAGEVGRQLLRRTMGAPAATGVAQRTLDLDPDSPTAAVAGIAGESTLGLGGGLAARVLSGMGGLAERSSRRSILNILQPRSAKEKTEATRLADVTRREGLVPPLSGRARQIVRAKRALGEASTTSRTLERQGVAAGIPVEAAPVVKSVIDEIPPVLPGGGMPATGRPLRQAATKAAEDVLNVVGATGRGPGGTQIPLEAAISERRRLDDLLAAMYEAGREQAPIGQRSLQNAADAYRAAIGDSFPELGAANLRLSDLISITKMMERSADEAMRTGGAGSSLQEAGAVGASIAGRLSIPAMLGARALVTAAPFASLSAAGKRVAAKLFEGGAQTAQLWVRTAELFGLNRTTQDEIRERERHRKAQAALQTQAEGVVAP